MRTASQFLQDSPFTDGQIFISPADGFNGAGNGGLTGNAFTISVPSTTTYHHWATLRNLLRTGTVPNYQEQFGTAALQPGPSSVANTSDPLNLTGVPPVKKASLATLTGGANGFVAKGIQLNWIDVIYSVGTANLTSADIGIFTNSFANNIAVASTTLLAQANNGLPLVVQANPYVTRVTPTTIKFITTTDTSIQIVLNAVTPGTGTMIYYGMVLGVSFNFN